MRRSRVTVPAFADAEALARRWRLEAADAEQWWAAAPADFLARHGRTLFDAGMTAEDVAFLYPLLDEDTAADLTPLVTAGRLADLEVRWLHWWARSGLLKPATGHGRTRRAGGHGGSRYTRWVTAARGYVAATGGNQEAAALAAAAGLGVEETATQHQAGALDLDALRLLAVLQ